MRFKITACLLLFFKSVASFAQDTTRILSPGYDPEQHKIIPDKVFEIGLPLLVIFLIANSVVNIFKIRAESRLKEKALDRQLSEPALMALFSQDRNLLKYSYLKLCLVLAAVGIALMYVHFLAQFARLQSPYLSLGVVALFLSLAFFIYYRIIRNK